MNPFLDDDEDDDFDSVFPLADDRDLKQQQDAMFEELSDLGAEDVEIDLPSAPIREPPRDESAVQDVILDLESAPATTVVDPVERMTDLGDEDRDRTGIEMSGVFREDIAVIQGAQEEPMVAEPDRPSARVDRLERNQVEVAYGPLPTDHGPLREGPGVG